MIKKIAVNTVMAVGAILVIGYVGRYFTDRLMPSGMKQAESIVDEVLERKKYGSLCEDDVKFIIMECLERAYPNGPPRKHVQEIEEKIAQKFADKLNEHNYNVPKSFWMEYIHGIFKRAKIYSEWEVG